MNTDTTSKPLTQEAYNKIKSMIIDLAFEPGEVLIIQQLSKRFNISRTPLREALVRLVEEGLVINAPGKKFKVTEFTLSDILDIYDMRENIECMVIDRKLCQITPRMVPQLKELISDMELAMSEKNKELFCDKDLLFHKCITSAYGSKILNGWIDSIEAKQQRIRHIGLIQEMQFEKTVREHKEIVAAIEAGDADDAKAKIRQHCRETLHGIERILMDTCVFSLQPHEIQRLQNLEDK